MAKRQAKERLVETPETTIWKIEITESAEAALKGIKDTRVRQKLVETIDDLQREPDRKGKALVGELSGFRGVRAVGQRYRIIYQVENRVVSVTIVFVVMRKDGDKKDVYALAKRLLDLLE